MLITFKTLQQKAFKIEIEETEKVKVLKEKISQEKGDEFPVEGQKLIYAGKILEDDKLISEYNIDTVKNFVVVMAVKPKKPAADKSGEASSSSTPAPSTPAATTTPAASTTTAASTTAPASGTTDTDTTGRSEQPAESGLVTGTALESSVTELMSLGYTREQVLRALNASFHNADRAAEYLLSGNIPDFGEDDGGDDAPAGGEGGNNAPTIPSGGGAQDLSFLSSLPQFQMMRNQVRDHPESLPQLLQEIGQANPQLLTLISQNQQGFIDLLNSSEEPAPGGGGGGGGGAGGAGGPGGFQIQVTPEEKESIDRIIAMGFPETEVVQAFFACDKNEQLTINLLLSG